MLGAPEAQSWEAEKSIDYLWDRFNIIAETVVADSASNVTYNVWGLDLDGTMQGAGGVGGLLAVISPLPLGESQGEGSTVYLPCYDANGNIMEYVSLDGAIAAHREYDPFGGAVVVTGDADAFTHWFSTKPWCAVTSLSEYQYRKYSPVVGRWMSRDPMEETSGLNLYAFCGNDTENKWDLQGLTTIGEILDEFFSFFNHRPDLWVMGEDDEYTTIVRNWDVVQNMVTLIKKDISLNPDKWEKHHKTSPSWKPSMAYVIDPNSGWERLVLSPPGTDPGTARENFEIYFWTEEETDELHTSAIGSFSIMATVSEIDVSKCTATANIWMYNEMSERSFGRFAEHWYFRHRPMASQFMWWNWKTSFEFDGEGGFVDVKEANNEW